MAWKKITLTVNLCSQAFWCKLCGKKISEISNACLPFLLYFSCLFTQQRKTPFPFPTKQDNTTKPSSLNHKHTIYYYMSTSQINPHTHIYNYCNFKKKEKKLKVKTQAYMLNQQATSIVVVWEYTAPIKLHAQKICCIPFVSFLLW